MTALRASLLKCNARNIFVNPVRRAAHWNKDWMPGPYPVTPAERDAAAKKYNLLPEEYEPDPDGFGDYPKLPDISGASKDQYYNYDFPSLKKDYGEPIHTLGNIISEDRWDINHEEKQQLPTYEQVLYFFGSLLIFGIPILYFNDKTVSLPHMKHHYPSDGPHYKYPK